MNHMITNKQIIYDDNSIKIMHELICDTLRGYLLDAEPNSL